MPSGILKMKKTKKKNIRENISTTNEESEVREEIKADALTKGHSAFDVFQKHCGEDKKDIKEDTFTASSVGASKPMDAAGLTKTLTDLSIDSLDKVAKFIPQLIQMKNSMKMKENKTVKESIPPTPRDIALKQAQEDMMKMFQEDPASAKEIIKQFKDRQQWVKQSRTNEATPVRPTDDQRTRQIAAKATPGVQKGPAINLDKLPTMNDYPKQGEEISDEDMQKLSSRFGKGGLNKEGKITLTKKQLKEVVSKAIEYKSQKHVIKEAMIVQVKEQITVRNLAESLLTEGPLSNAFRGISGALQGGAQAAGKAVAGIGQAAKAKAMQSVEQGRAQDKAKEMRSQISTFFKNAAKAKEKFSQEKLKNATLVNQYHDAVVNLNTALEQIKPHLSEPEAEKFGQEASSAINNLYYDLTSEKEGIDVFLKTLRDSVPKLQGKNSGTNAVKAAKKSLDDGPDGRKAIKGGFGRPSERGTRKF